MPLIVRDFEEVVIGELAPRMQDPDGIAPNALRVSKTAQSIVLVRAANRPNMADAS